MVAPQTSYARNGDVNIAYQVFGEGSVDLSFTPWIGGLEVALEQPRFMAFLERLAGFARVIRHDRRATGLSDRAAFLPDLETQVDDLEAVLNATGSASTAMLGTGAGFGAAAMFATMHPRAHGGIAPLWCESAKCAIRRLPVGAIRIEVSSLAPIRGGRLGYGGVCGQVPR